MDSIYDILVHRLDGSEYALREHENKVLLVVNTASHCGFTPQYEGLESLHKKYSPRGFAVLGFPCNQFGKQEPGTAEEIGEFCRARFDVSFPLHEKIEVNGAREHSLYKKLKQDAPGLMGTKAIKWNFTKFLVDRRGNTVKRFSPSAAPRDLESDIERLL